ncbi:MAG: class I SAM-dependent methyltransferase [Sneathiella sp.]
MIATQPDYTAIKTKQQATWGSGDYATVGTTLNIVGEQLCEAMDLHSGQTVLDVAAGNGNATLAAARRWCEVTSTDYVESLLARGKERADADRLDVAFQQADAEDLPFDSGSFDAVMSTFGVMFTPNQLQSASEMTRVCRSGGKIGMANWTPESFIGHLFKTIGKHVPPPVGVQSPALWGTKDRLSEMFGESATTIEITSRLFNFRYRSTDHFLDVFRNLYGPVHKAFSALDAAGQEALTRDIAGLVETFNVATDGTMIVPAEYAEVVITKK